MSQTPADSQSADAQLLRTPLHGRHVALGARMVPFAGYDMPVQYAGIIAEHLHTRAHAGLFDVSHMGQGWIAGPDHETTARALETLVPGDILGLKPGQQRYTLLLNAQGGVLDDLMVARPAAPGLDGRLMLVVNAACREADWLHLSGNLPAGVRVEPETGRALLALQGPEAAQVMARLAPAAEGLPFMGVIDLAVGGIEARVSRSGYTGEDGFEISVAAADAVALWDLLLAQPEVKPAGLGARDTLRLEAGLCLYGHDLNQETSPVEAGLAWTVPRRRREDMRFPGAIRITGEIRDGALRRRVGLRPQGRAPVREGARIFDAAGELVGEVTSGGFGPSVGAPVAMGYVVADFARPGTAVQVELRGRMMPAVVAPLPFTPHRYRR